MRPGAVAPTMTRMPSATEHDVPVLIIGAGPAGLAAAIELTRHDIPTLLIERRTRLSSHPRATVLSLRSMEIVRAWGLEAEVWAQSVPDVDWRMLDAQTLRDLDAGVPDLPIRLEQSRHFSSAAQVAERWRSGSVFLAGDAAHRVTPRGGTGLNLALHDGYELGWKLAWVLRGWAGAELLDSYEAERRPVAEHTVARSADPQGSIRPAETEVRADLGARLAHAWSGDRSTLDL